MIVIEKEHEVDTANLTRKRHEVEGRLFLYLGLGRYFNEKNELKLQLVKLI
jgi:hypothetical protein